MTEAERKQLEREMANTKKAMAEEKAKKEKDADIRHHMWE